MNITPEQFLQGLKDGKTETELNHTESGYIDHIELTKLTSRKYGHTLESAKDHLLTDYSNGFTICNQCGSFYQLGNGFTKHLSNGCLHCEGEAKHNTYQHKGNKPERGWAGTQPRQMSQMFDDGMHYCVAKLEKEKYKSLILEISNF